ncbi:ATP-binding protein [Desulfonatronovibrio magnus]|uniref:ATP-binding protein n=1 Tax=Desulfonatronovibrio magnus TaxID=698827 RepID=UPI0005EBCD20|nr:DUF499 domain-containing protein [Desulfonatronovibrio magnus]
MQYIIDSCQPREDLIAGTFNPEIFTASLPEVIRFYQENKQGVHPIYTDAEQFFSHGTYVTDGLKTVLSEVFSRIAGDLTVPAIHRLETAFGGGKSHTLIACTHIGYKGKEISPYVGDILDENLLPEKGEIHVAGVAGNELPVHKPQGAKLIPYTLWGEIAYQLGGEDLYMAVESDAASYSAPGKNYFDTIFSGKKALIMIDELAQYAARLSAARPDGSEQLAAFLMSLHEYARTNTGISIVLTLASATDAFAISTGVLTDLLNSVTGQEINQDEALEIGQQAVKGIASVVSRDAVPVVPVQAAEISRVLSRRLFASIDEAAAKETASLYMEMYRKSSSLLPDESTREDFQDRLVSHYPFHPAFIDFLNNKLATYENFQGTRGVLRILSLAVRRLWQRQVKVPMIHTCHLDLRDARTVSEVVGRSGSSDLLTVLNADVGGADTDALTGGKSNAEIADQKNPHPEKWPMYEYTWKTVFLHSLVGRDQGVGSRIFGLATQDALFEVSFPGLTPPQVAAALKEIDNSAYYLRFNQGRYYASLDPSVNIALARLRRGLSVEAVDSLLAASARKVISSDISKFNIVPDVSAPEDIPDKKGVPTIALISLDAGTIEVEPFITTAGQNRPRIEQNHIFLLVPDTVTVSPGTRGPGYQLPSSTAKAVEKLNKLKDMARTVLAWRELKKNPQNHGITPHKLNADEHTSRHQERENSFASSVADSFRHLWYPSASGQIVSREIKSSGAEGGTAVIEQIRKTLLDNGELVTTSHADLSGLTNLKKLFFSQNDVAELEKLRDNFKAIRSWPVLESPELLDQLVRAGVSKGTWCMFRMGSADSTFPEEFYSKEEGDVPLDLNMGSGYSLITMEGARQRQWSHTAGPDPRKIQSYVQEEIQSNPKEKIANLHAKINEKYGDIPEKDVLEAVKILIRDNRLYAVKQPVGSEQDTDLIGSGSAAIYMPDPGDCIMTPAKAAEEGLLQPEDRTIRLMGRDGAEVIMPLLRRIGSMYQRGAKTSIDMLDISGLKLPSGGTLRIAIENTGPDSIKDLAELFETIDGLAEATGNTECYLEINNPEEDCEFVKAVKQTKK